MGRSVKLRTLLGIIDIHNYVAIVTKHPNGKMALLGEESCHKAKKLFKQYLNYDSISMGSDSEGTIIIEIVKPTEK